MKVRRVGLCMSRNEQAETVYPRSLLYNVFRRLLEIVFML